MKDFVGKVSEKITKLSDEELGRLFNAINAENEIFSSIMDSLSSGLIILDTEFCILKFNRSAQRYIPFVARFYEKKDKVWNLVSDEEISAFLEHSLISQDSSVSEEFSVFNGQKVRFITVSILPLVYEQLIKGWIISIEDRTAKRQQEILTHRMESLRSLTNLAASVAHEIKNPLGAISIHVQLLQKAVKKAREKDGLLPDEKFMENYLNVVNEEIENLNKIVIDFLFATRPVQAELVLHAADSIIKKTTDFFMPELADKGIALTVELCDDCPKVLIDEKLFREILVNLVQNASHAVLSKYSKEGLKSLEKPEIVIKSICSRDKYIVTVADNGCGMDSETCSRVFEPYYTTKADGTGLGLTTVYKIIKEFNGDISVSSQEGEGTIFTLSVPVPQTSTRLLESDGGAK